MTFGEFKKIVAGFMNRDTADFTVNQIDLLSRAINQARKWAERTHDFELARTSGYVEGVHFQNGATLGGAKREHDDSALSIKTIERPFLATSDGLRIPIGLMTRKRHMSLLERAYENQRTVTPISSVPLANRSYVSVVVHGDRVYFTPASTEVLNGAETTTLYFDVVAWMKDYKNENDTDFLMEHCEDFLLYRSVAQLNMLIKEDMRVPISAQAMTDAWKSVVSWDVGMVQMNTDDNTLD